MGLSLASLLLALAYLVPEHYLPWESFRSQLVAALAALTFGAIAMVAKGATPRRQAWRWPWMACVPLALAAVPWLQWLAGSVIFRADALLPSLYLLGLALAIGTGARWAALDASAFLRALAFGLILAAVVSTAIALSQYLHADALFMALPLQPGARPGGNLAQPNHLATLVVMALSMTLLCFERRWLSGAVCGLIAALLTVGLVSSMSRSGGVSFAGLVLLATLARERLGLRVGRAALLGWLAGGIALAACWDSLSQALQLGSLDLSGRTQAGTRLTHWAALWDAVMLSPWWGHGWNQVALAQQLTAHLHPPTGEFLQSSHNAPLDLWVWIGLPAGTLTCALFAWWYFGSWLRCRTATTACVLATITAVVVHAMVEYPLDYAYFLLPFGLLIGVAEGMDPTRTPALRTPVAVPALALIGSSCMLMWIASEYLLVEERFREARLALLGFGGGQQIVEPPPVVLLDNLREYHRLVITPAHAKMSAAQLAWMRDVVRRYPFPPALMRYALAAGLNGQPEEARRALRGLCAVHVAQRCEEGRDAWLLAQAQYPELKAVPFVAPVHNSSRLKAPMPGGTATSQGHAGQ